MLPCLAISPPSATTISPRNGSSRRRRWRCDELARAWPIGRATPAEKPARTARSRACRLRRGRASSATSATSTSPCWKTAERPTCGLRPAGRRHRPLPQRPGRPRQHPALVAARVGREADPLTVAHAGAYFETTSLLAAWPQRCSGQIAAVGRQCRHRHRRAGLVRRPFRLRTGRLPRARHVAAARHHDGRGRRTISALPCRRRRRLPAGRDRLSSGLKLDQAGLELANVGIVRVLARDGAHQRATGIAGRLRQLRGLTGSGPDARRAVGAFRAVVSRSRLCRSPTPQPSSPTTARSPQSIGTRLGRLRRALPSFAGRIRAAAPFCALQLQRSHRPRATGAWPKSSSSRASSAACSLTKGGSFGFRGHRFELIEPDLGKAMPSCASPWAGATAIAAAASPSF